VRRFFATVARVSRWAHDEPEEFWAALDGHPEVRQDATLAAFREILLAGQPPVWAGETYHVLAPEALDLEPGDDEVVMVEGKDGLVATYAVAVEEDGTVNVWPVVFSDDVERAEVAKEDWDRRAEDSSSVKTLSSGNGASVCGTSEG